MLQPLLKFCATAWAASLSTSNIVVQLTNGMGIGAVMEPTCGCELPIRVAFVLHAKKVSSAIIEASIVIVQVPSEKWHGLAQLSSALSVRGVSLRAYVGNSLFPNGS